MTDRPLFDLPAATCPRCGRPAVGLARINTVRYCHDPDDRPTCYEWAMFEKGLTRYSPDGDEWKAADDG